MRLLDMCRCLEECEYSIHSSRRGHVCLSRLEVRLLALPALKSHDSHNGVVQSRASSPSCLMALHSMLCRCFLEDATWEAEDLLWNEIVNNCQIVLTPGSFFHAPEPGFFRCGKVQLGIT